MAKKPAPSEAFNAVAALPAAARLNAYLVTAGGKATVADAQTLHHDGADINALDDSGNTCVMLAVQAGAQAVLEYLIDQKANYTRANAAKITPAMASALYNDTAAAKVLAAAGARLSPAEIKTLMDIASKTKPVPAGLSTRQKDKLAPALQHVTRVLTIYSRAAAAEKSKTRKNPSPKSK